MWSFGAAINAAFGGYHVLRNGAAQDTPSANGTWQLKKAVDGTMWAMDMAGFQWYHWHDSAWVATGTAPPVDGTNGMPAALENTSNSLSDTPTMHTWLGRIPDLIAGLPSGPPGLLWFRWIFPAEWYGLIERLSLCRRKAFLKFLALNFPLSFEPV